ncbi:MAG: AAA family ATPase, partial [Thermoguttaceae bacterium]|nr:AAA family ATPase [Thermoguttaceae bacterium]
MQEEDDSVDREAISDESGEAADARTLLQLEVGALARELDAVQRRLQKAQQRVRELANFDASLERLNQIQQSADDVLTRPTALADEGIPPFIPVAERPLGPNGVSTRVLAFLNLKGGVGKTTLSANLAAAFASGNYGKGLTGARPLRVLVVDLDFQGSLSRRCVNNLALTQASSREQTSARLLSPPSPTGSSTALARDFIHLE